MEEEKEIYIKFSRNGKNIRWEDSEKLDAGLIGTAIVTLQDMLLKSVIEEKENIKDDLGYDLNVKSQREEFIRNFLEDLKKNLEWEDVKYN